jgi:hypothetical protein
MITKSWFDIFKLKYKSAKSIKNTAHSFEQVNISGKVPWNFAEMSFDHISYLSFISYKVERNIAKYKLILTSQVHSKSMSE